MNFRLFLLPFSFLYSGITRFRNMLFDTGILKSRKFNFPVILVGNLSTGGTGKTPHVEYLVRLLQKNNRIATLSRGYGRRTSGFIIADKNASAENIGDEPMQYHVKFADITVAVCEKRAEGISNLMDTGKTDVIIMDDGYQHRHVNPGFKILLTPVNNLYSSDYLLPAGNLREPRSGSERAQCIVVTRCRENMPQSVKEDIAKALQPSKGQHLFFSSVSYDTPVHFFSGSSMKLTELAERNVVLFTGIADKSLFREFVEKHSENVTAIRFADHHQFTTSDMVMVRKKFDMFTDRQAVIITTEKDYCRLKGTPIIQELKDLPCYYIPIRIKIDREEEFNRIINDYVEQNKGNR